MSDPAAWRVYDTDGSEAVYCTGEEARAAAYEWNWSIEPLYRSPTLTDAEREAIAVCIEDIRFEDVQATLRGLLERTSRSREP